MTTTTTTQNEAAATWRPLASGEILLLPFWANLTQLKSEQLARCSAAETIGSLILIEAVQLNDDCLSGRILFRYVNNNNGEVGRLWTIHAKATLLPDRSGRNVKPLWTIVKDSLEIIG